MHFLLYKKRKEEEEEEVEGLKDKSQQRQEQEQQQQQQHAIWIRMSHNSCENLLLIDGGLGRDLSFWKGQ